MTLQNNKRSRTTISNFRRGLLGLALGVVTVSHVQAQTIYAGPAAAQGASVTAGNSGFGLGTITFDSGIASATYTNNLATPVLITLDSFNFYVTANTLGTVQPFLSIYNGGGVTLGSSYSVVKLGDVYTKSTLPAGLVNTSFSASGNTYILAAGATLSIGVTTTRTSGGSNLISIGNVSDPSYVGAMYVSQGVTTVPGTIPNNLTGNGYPSPNSDSIAKYNVGFTVVAVPEPSTIGLGFIGLTGLMVVLRRRRTLAA